MKVTRKPDKLVTPEGICTIFIEEEQSKDVETSHKGERVGWMAFPGAAPVVLVNMQTCNEADRAVVRYVKTLGSTDSFQLAVSAQDEAGDTVVGVVVTVTEQAGTSAAIVTGAEAAVRTYHQGAVLTPRPKKALWTRGRHWSSTTGSWMVRPCQEGNAVSRSRRRATGRPRPYTPLRGLDGIRNG